MRIRYLLPLLLPLLLCHPAAGAHVPEKPSLHAMIGQMIMAGFRGDGIPPHGKELLGVLEDIRAGRIGGVILFDRDWQTKKRGRNIRSADQVAALCTLLQNKAPIPLFIGIDQEGGSVRRLRPDHGFMETPAAEVLGRDTPAATGATAERLGKALHALGINVNFAPVADVAVPDSPAIGALGRAFSGDARTVSAHADAFVRGLAAARVIGCYKHFPGHGSALTDTHTSLTDITATWREEELLPYTDLPDNAPFMVMTAHLVHRHLDPQHPASLSRSITTGILRETLGWQGVVITDDLEMDATARHYPLKERIRLAIHAGADILLFGNNLRHVPDQGRRVHAVITELVHDGSVSADRIARSWERIRHLKKILLARPQ